MENKIWSKHIPILNYIFLGLSVALLLFVDFPMASGDSTLWGFFEMMLNVFGVFILFIGLENFVFSRARAFKFERAKVDRAIYIFIFLRNFILLLNFIPFIQLLGLAAVIYGGIPLFIIYAALLGARFKNTPTPPPTPGPQSSA